MSMKYPHFIAIAANSAFWLSPLHLRFARPLEDQWQCHIFLQPPGALGHFIEPRRHDAMMPPQDVVRMMWINGIQQMELSVKIRWYLICLAGHMWVTKPMGNTYGKYLWDDYWDDYCWLVVSTYPEKWWSEFVNWDDEIPNWMEQKTCSKPSTSHMFGQYVGRFPQK